VARLACCPARLNTYVNSVCLFEDLLEGTDEPGDDCAAVQRCFSLEDELRLIVPMHGDGPCFWIHHPHETDAASEVLVHLRRYLGAPISRRSDFDCKIRWSRPEPIRHPGRRDAFSPNERNVRLADRVGPAGEMKATGGHHYSETQRFDVRIQQPGDSRRENSVTAAGRAHSDNPALDQFVSMVVVWDSCELFDRNQALA
jgi:hypothetical protein